MWSGPSPSRLTARPWPWITAHCVVLQDNGSGMPHKDIPNMLGKVLSGTKYGVKQVGFCRQEAMRCWGCFMPCSAWLIEEVLPGHAISLMHNGVIHAA